MTPTDRTRDRRRFPRRRHASDIDAAIGYINDAKDTLDQALEALQGTTPPEPEPPPSGDTIPVAAGTPLQPVIDAAPAGSILALAVGSYPGSLHLRQPITLQPQATVPEGRATKAGNGVEIIGSTDEDAVTIDGGDVTLLGVTVRTTHQSRQVVAFTGTDAVLDRCTLLGDPGFGAHRGAMLNGAGVVVSQCYVADIFDVGRDTQAISGWDGCRDVSIDDCYLEGAGETIMFGGADSTSPDRMPTNIRVTNSTLTKNPEWVARGIQVKNALELKCAIDFEMENCILEYGGTAEGQGAYLILLSTRNQDGTAPWTTIQHVKIRNCHARHAGAGIKILGRDDGQESVVMQDVVLDEIMFSDIDAATYGGDSRGITIMGAPDALTIQNVTIEAVNLGSTMYLIPEPLLPTNLVLRNLKLPESDYGMKIDGGGKGPDAWQEAMPDAIIELTPADTGATDYPQ